jgi:signal transduction histidine kinase
VREGNTHVILGARLTVDARIDEIAVICHELRNSLAVVRGAAHLLKSPAAGDVIDHVRALIERHAGQMSRHIEDLLEPSRRGGRGQGLQLSHVDLRVVARHALDSIAPEMERRGHRLVATLPVEALWAQVDGARLEQAFANLLINAAKYTPDGGDIHFILECLEGQVYVRVRDSGVGIAPAALSGVFGMYVQVGNALPRIGGGSGIGLAVVRNLVELHGGTVQGMSAGLGSGSEFTIVLPHPVITNGASACSARAGRLANPINS